MALHAPAVFTPMGDPYAGMKQVQQTFTNLMNDYWRGEQMRQSQYNQAATLQHQYINDALNFERNRLSAERAKQQAEALQAFREAQLERLWASTNERKRHNEAMEELRGTPKEQTSAKERIAAAADEQLNLFAQGLSADPELMAELGPQFDTLPNEDQNKALTRARDIITAKAREARLANPEKIAETIPLFNRRNAMYKRRRDQINEEGMWGHLWRGVGEGVGNVVDTFKNLLPGVEPLDLARERLDKSKRLYSEYVDTAGNLTNSPTDDKGNPNARNPEFNAKARDEWLAQQMGKDNRSLLTMAGSFVPDLAAMMLTGGLGGAVGKRGALWAAENFGKAKGGKLLQKFLSNPAAIGSASGAAALTALYSGSGGSLSAADIAVLASNNPTEQQQIYDKISFWMKTASGAGGAIVALPSFKKIFGKSATEATAAKEIREIMARAENNAAALRGSSAEKFVKDAIQDANKTAQQGMLSRVGSNAMRGLIEHAKPLDRGGNMALYGALEGAGQGYGVGKAFQKEGDDSTPWGNITSGAGWGALSGYGAGLALGAGAGAARGLFRPPAAEARIRAMQERLKNGANLSEDDFREAWNVLAGNPEPPTTPTSGSGGAAVPVPTADRNTFKFLDDVDLTDKDMNRLQQLKVLFQPNSKAKDAINAGKIFDSSSAEEPPADGFGLKPIEIDFLERLLTDNSENPVPLTRDELVQRLIDLDVKNNGHFFHNQFSKSSLKNKYKAVPKDNLRKQWAETVADRLEPLLERFKAREQTAAMDDLINRINANRPAAPVEEPPVSAPVQTEAKPAEAKPAAPAPAPVEEPKPAAATPAPAEVKPAEQWQDEIDEAPLLNVPRLSDFDTIRSDIANLPDSPNKATLLANLERYKDFYESASKLEDKRKKSSNGELSADEKDEFNNLMTFLRSLDKGIKELHQRLLHPEATAAPQAAATPRPSVDIESLEALYAEKSRNRDIKVSKMFELVKLRREKGLSEVGERALNTYKKAVERLNAQLITLERQIDEERAKQNPGGSGDGTGGEQAGAAGGRLQTPAADSSAAESRPPANRGVGAGQPQGQDASTGENSVGSSVPQGDVREQTTDRNAGTPVGQAGTGDIGGRETATEAGGLGQPGDTTEATGEEPLTFDLRTMLSDRAGLKELAKRYKNPTLDGGYVPLGDALNDKQQGDIDFDPVYGTGVKGRTDKDIVRKLINIVRDISKDKYNTKINLSEAMAVADQFVRTLADYTDISAEGMSASLPVDAKLILYDWWDKVLKNIFTAKNETAMPAAVKTIKQLLGGYGSEKPTPEDLFMHTEIIRAMLESICGR